MRFPALVTRTLAGMGGMLWQNDNALEGAIHDSAGYAGLQYLIGLVAAWGWRFRPLLSSR